MSGAQRKSVFPLLLIALIAIFVSGCSVVDLAYNNAPGFVESRIDDAFDLRDEQRRRLSQQVNAFFQWHRREELPLYADVLEQTARDLSDGVQSADFERLLAAFMEARRRSVARAIDQMSPLLLTMDEAQWESFNEAFQERLEEDFERSVLPAEERLLELARKNADRVEDWFGDLDVDQYRVAEAAFMALPDFHEAWVQQRVRRQQNVVGFFRQKPDEDAVREQLTAWFVSRSEGVPPEYENRRQAYWQAYGEALVRVSAVLSPEQWGQAADEMREYAAIFRRLSTEAG